MGVAFLAALVTGALAIALPKYEASGFYYTPGWTLAEYKRFRSEFGWSDNLDAYFRTYKPRFEDAAPLLVARSRTPRFWEDSAKALYPITKKDAREIFETTKDKESSTIIGLELRIAAGDPATAREAVETLGDYLTQTLLLTTLQGWISSGQAASNAERLKAENEVLQTRYALEQTRERIDDLQALQSKYPEAQRMEVRQVVSADANSARYLAPISQVIALESSAAEMNEALRRMERRERQMRVELSFFDGAAVASREVRHGGLLLDRLAAVRDSVFSGLDPSDDAIREVANRFSLDLKAFRDQFSIGFGFRSPVLEPTRSTRNLAQLTLAGAVLGMLLGVAGAIVAGWLNDRRSSVGARLQPIGSAVLRAAE